MEPTPLPPPLPVPPMRRRRRWLRGVLALVAVVILVPVGIYLYLSYAQRAGWADAEADAARSDPRWRLADLIAEQETIPDAENSALHIVAVVGKAKIVRVSGTTSTYNLIFADLPPDAVLNDQQLALLRAELGKIAKPLEEARQLKNLPRGRFPVKYGDDYISTLLPDHHKARHIVDWLTHDAYVLAHDKQFDQAVESCHAALNAGRTMREDLFLISHLIRSSIQIETATALERVLAQGVASEVSLAAMQAIVETEIRESSWLRAMRGERAGAHLLFENLRTGKISQAKYLRAMATGKPPANLLERINDHFPSTLLKYYPEHLQHMTRGVEIAKLPIDAQRKPVQEWDTQGKDSRNPITTLMRPAIWKVYESECRSQATLRAMQAAIACERYRLRRGHWPEALDALVEEKLLNEVPRDPIDGQTMRLQRHATFIVVYSIGNDLTDNHGHIDHTRVNDPGVDVGFRLWDEKHRRAPPRPMVKVPAP